MRLLLALILCCCCYAEILFVRPVLQEQRQGSLAAVQRIDLSGQKFLQFEAAPGMPQMLEELNFSPLMRHIFDLRSMAMSIATSFGRPVPDVRKLLVYAGDDLGKVGPAMATGLPIYVENPSGRASALMILSTMRHGSTELPVEAFAVRKYLKAVLAHEVFHEIMAILYGDELQTIKARSTTRKGHDSHLVTDPFLAFLEGTAEALEIAVAEMFPQEVASRSESEASLSPQQSLLMEGFIRRRIQLAGRNRFVFTADGSRLDGSVDDPKTLLSTEGNIASLFYKVMFQSNVTEPVAKVLQVLAAVRPHDFMGFLTGFSQMFPEDWVGVRRQFLESTYFVTVSADAAQVYQRSYLAQKRFKQSGDRLDSDELRAVWQDLKSTLLTDVSNGVLPLDANVPYPYIVSDAGHFYQVDLNQATSADLEDVLIELLDGSGISEDPGVLAARIARERDKGVVIRSMESLELPIEVEAILEKSHHDFLAYQNSLLEQRKAKISQAFVQAYFEDTSEVLFSHSR